MFVKPKKGVRVIRHDILRPLPAEGADVADNFYWHRRALQGDVEPLTATAPAPPHAARSGAGTSAAPAVTAEPAPAANS